MRGWDPVTSSVSTRLIVCPGPRNPRAERRNCSGASVAMKMLRRQAQIGALISIVGVVLVFFGFYLK